MKDLPTYLCYTGFAFLFVKAYLQLQYDRQRRKTSALFLRWFLGAYAFSIMFPIISQPNTLKQDRLKRNANITLLIAYVFFVSTLVVIYVFYKK